MNRASLVVGLVCAGGVTASASPAATLVSGRVEGVSSRWASGGDTIVTDVDVRMADGHLVHAVALGGVVDGIGMAYSHTPRVPAPGEQIVLAGRGSFERMAIQAIAAGGAAVADGTAVYGLRRTQLTKRPLHPSASLHFVYDAAGTSAIAGDREFSILDDAFAAWSGAAAGCGGLTFSSSIAPALQTAVDGVNTVVFREDRWCRPATTTEPELCYDPGVAAVTRLIWTDEPGDSDDGHILEADIEINAVDYALSDRGVSLNTTAASVADLGDIVTHEVGHALGLTHNCWEGDGTRPLDLDGRAIPDCAAVAPDSETTRATMYFTINEPGETAKQTLEAGDRDGACAVARTATRPSADITGGCSSGRGVGWPLVLLVLAGWLRRAIGPCAGARSRTCRAARPERGA